MLPPPYNGFDKILGNHSGNCVIRLQIKSTLFGSALVMNVFKEKLLGGNTVFWILRFSLVAEIKKGEIYKQRARMNYKSERSKIIFKGKYLPSQTLQE